MDKEESNQCGISHAADHVSIPDGHTYVLQRLARILLEV